MPISEPIAVVDELGQVNAWRYRGMGIDGEDVDFPVVTVNQAPSRAVISSECFKGDFETLGASCRFDYLDSWPSDVMRPVRGYIANFRQAAAERKGGLIIYGDPGTGKTTLASAICNELMDKGVKCKMTSLKLVDDAALSKYGVTEPIIAALARFELIVFDDFNPSTANAQRVERVFSVIDGLEKRRIPMMITTNLTERQLANPDPNRNDVRVFDRIKAQAGAVHVTGPNRRQVRMQ